MRSESRDPTLITRARSPPSRVVPSGSRGLELSSAAFIRGTVGGRATARARGARGARISHISLSRERERARLARVYFASTASCTASITFCVEVALSHLSWPIVVLECTSLPSTVTSKLPVVPGSWISSIAMSSPNSPVSVEASAVKYFLYPHPPQYWIETLTAESAMVACVCACGKRAAPSG